MNPTGGPSAAGPADRLAAARRARAAGKREAARQLCADHLARKPGDAEAHHFMATLAAEAGRLDVALVHARKAATLAPWAYPARLDLARILMLSGEEKAALKEATAALALRKDDFAARFEHARLLFNSSARADAEPALAALAAERPGFGEAEAMLAALRVAADRFAEALASADRAVAAGVDAAEIHEIRGRALLGLGRLEPARAAFEAALAREPNRLAALRLLSHVLMALGEAGRSRETVRRHVALAPYETFGDDGAEIRMLVGEPLALTGAFPADSVSKMYGRLGFILTFSAPGLQRVHYPVNNVAASEVARLVGGANLVFNNIPTGEQIELMGGAEPLAEIYAECGLPVLNPVEQVARTTRAENYRRLKDDPAFLFPRTRRFEVGDDPAGAAKRILAEFEPPFMVRPLHTNYRAGLKLVRKAEELAEAEALRAGGAVYAIDYHPSRLRLSDGTEGALQFRAAVVNGLVFADRMNWSKGDYTDAAMDRTKIGYNERGVTELEKAFLKAPEDRLGRPLQEIFGDLVKVVGLDMFGIDFGLTEDGRVVVFEANAAMSLYSRKHEKYGPYRREYREAFVAEAMSMFRARSVPR